MKMAYGSRATILASLWLLSASATNVDEILSSIEAAKCNLATATGTTEVLGSLSGCAPPPPNTGGQGPDTPSASPGQSPLLIAPATGPNAQPPVMNPSDVAPGQPGGDLAPSSGPASNVPPSAGQSPPAAGMPSRAFGPSAAPQPSVSDISAPGMSLPPGVSNSPGPDVGVPALQPSLPDFGPSPSVSDNPSPDVPLPPDGLDSPAPGPDVGVDVPAPQPSVSACLAINLASGPELGAYASIETPGYDQSASTTLGQTFTTGGECVILSSFTLGLQATNNDGSVFFRALLYTFDLSTRKVIGSALASQPTSANPADTRLTVTFPQSIELSPATSYVVILTTSGQGQGSLSRGINCKVSRVGNPNEIPDGILLYQENGDDFASIETTPFRSFSGAYNLVITIN